MYTVENCSNFALFIKRTARVTHCFQLSVHCVVHGLVLSCSVKAELASEVHLTVYYESDSFSHSFIHSYSLSQSRQVPNSRKTVRNNERIKELIVELSFGAIVDCVIIDDFSSTQRK